MNRPFSILAAALALCGLDPTLNAQESTAAQPDIEPPSLEELEARKQQFLADLEAAHKDVEENGETLEKLEKIGDMYLSVGETQRAIMVFDRAIRNFGGTEDLFQKFARVLLLSGRPQLGADVLAIGLEAFPDSELLNGEIGKAYVALQKPYAAISALKRAIELNPQEERYRYHLADAYRSQRKLDEAVAIIDQLIEEESEFLPVYLMKGDLLLAQGEERRGVRFIEELHEEHPESREIKVLLVHAYQMYAYTEAKAGRLSRAIKSLESALELEPNDPESLASVGSFHYEAGDFGEAEKAYKKVLDAHPGYFDVYGLYATLLNFLDRKSEVQELYRRALAEARKAGSENAVKHFSNLLANARNSVSSAQ